MSGGSYNYAYRAIFPCSDLRDMTENIQSLTELAESMAAEGYAAGAVPIMQAISQYRIAEAWFEAVTADGQLANVAKSYEWWKSSDGSRDDFEATLAQFVSASDNNRET